jgi:hypothetical protein
MGRRVDALVELPESRWVGRLDFDVTTPSGGFLGRVEMKVGYDDVQVYYANRHMALIDRARLHRWFQRPRSPLTSDDVTLSMRGRDVVLGLELAPGFPLPRRIAAQLLAVV